MLTKRRFLLAAVVSFVLALLASPALAYFTDFNGLPRLTPVESLSIPGMTFAAQTPGDWIVDTDPGLLSWNEFIANGHGISDLPALLTITFAMPQTSISLRFATFAVGERVTMTGYSGMTQVFIQSATGTLVSKYPEGVLSMSGVTFDSVVISHTGTFNIAIDDISTGTASSAPPGAPAGSISPVPHLGMVQIATWQAQPVYQSPGGGVVRDSAAREIWLPQDADGNGFDTYVVTDVAVVDGEVWLGLWMGSLDWAYVPLDGVTPLTYIEGAETNGDSSH